MEILPEEPEFDETYYEGLLIQERRSSDKHACQMARIETNKLILQEYNAGIKNAFEDVKVIFKKETRQCVLEDFLVNVLVWPYEHFNVVYGILLKRNNSSDWKEERQMLGEMRQLMINQILAKDPSYEKKLSYVIQQESWNEVFTFLVRKLIYLQDVKDTLLCIDWTAVYNWVVIKNLNEGMPEYLENMINNLIELADKKGDIGKFREASLQDSPTIQELLKEMGKNKTTQ